MRTYTSETKPEIEPVENVIYLWLDFKEETNTEGDNQYSYHMIKIVRDDNRNKIIEKIVKTKYPSYDTEIAALSNNDPEHSSWRQFSKNKADEVLQLRRQTQ